MHRALLFILPVLFFLPARAGTWLDSAQQAVTRAQKENKLVLAFYTEPDSSLVPADAHISTACRKLAREVLSQPEFLQYAKAHLVLLKLDYSTGADQSADLREQNHQMLHYFDPEVKTFPALLLFNGNWTEIARREDARFDNPAALIEWLQKSAAAPGH